MKTIAKLLLGLLVVAIATLTGGCATENVKQALDNLHGDCERHYSGSVGGGVAGTGTVMTFDIKCTPEGRPAAPTPAPAAPKPPGG